MNGRSPLIPELREQLYSLIGEIIERSADRSCFASERTLARTLRRRTADVHAAKLELIASGRLNLTFRANGARRNPRHRLTLPTTPPPPLSDARHAPPCGTCGARPYMALNLWADMPRMDLIDCYFRSGMNACPLKPLTKHPVYRRATWATYDRDRRIDIFWRNKNYGVGLWLEPDLTVFDFDSDRTVEYDTLISKRGPRHHAYFQGHEEIYNLPKINRSEDFAGDIDTRACGGLIVLPPTLHENGVDRYEWEQLRAPAPVPDDLLELWRNRQSARTRGGEVFRLGDLPAVIPQGERDNTLWAYGRRLRAAGMTRAEIDMRLRRINQERCAPPLDDGYMSSKIEHVWKHKNDPRYWGNGSDD